jgi:hypothetical protein
MVGRESGDAVSLLLDLGRSSGFSDRFTGLSAHSEPLGFANFAIPGPLINRHQAVDHFGAALTQQVRRVLFSFAKVAVHVCVVLQFQGR